MTAKPPQEFLGNYKVALPSSDEFHVCSRFGCDNITQIRYSQDQWQQLQAIFVPPSTDSLEERQRIGTAIGLMEQFTGKLANTYNDQAKNDGWLAGGSQLDCIAESANTTVALMQLQQRGWLRFHDILYPSHRGLLSLQAPHNAATIKDRQNGASYVVDSWFFANGVEPTIVTTERWKSGYDPN
ncbi:MAG: hypothetical protein OQK12_10740 [Motiliproteus sp.]|nr:hypothetical protein [Motiliproteus sp.]MCW9054253.1 hypothetical protein [Motiliproteus sp.]